MDTLSVARQASAFGLMPPVYVKSVLVSPTVSPLLPRSGGLTTVSENAFLHAMLYEALLYLVRSMSHLVGYEAAVAKDQYSWAAVTLYYANYYCVLSMNRIAGEAISTATSGKTYRVKLNSAPFLFDIEGMEVNNHKEVWKSNYRLYETFNWRDTSLDGIIVKVPTSRQNDHPERKAREIINYHPDSYQEIVATSSRHRQIKAACGNHFNTSPAIIAQLPIVGEFERKIAMFESHAVARQTLLLAIFEEVFKELNTRPSSRICVSEIFSQFSRNYLTHPPFRTKLKLLYEEKLSKFRIG